MTALTINDLRSDKVQSGFRFVNTNNSGGVKGHGGGKPYYARVGVNSRGIKAGEPSWNGPRRATPEEAAQDYCDYVNSQQDATPAAPALKSAGHVRAPRERTEASELVQEARAALRAAVELERAKNQESRGFIYLIGETYGPPGTKPVYDEGWLVSCRAVKVGHSDQPDGWRISSLQTSNPRILVMLGTIQDRNKDDESALHAKYIEHNVLQEWFRPTPELLSEFGVKARVMERFGAMWVEQEGEV